jgi:hypothetical protein
MMCSRLSVFVIGAAALASCAGSALAQYRVGDFWQRSLDWTPGTAEGYNFARGNPDDDSKGFPVWSAEWVTGGGPLGSGDVWYDNPPTLMMWQDMPFGEPLPRWLKGLDNGPQVKNVRLDHDLDGPPANLFPNMPAVRWTNPTRQNIGVSISGDITVLWNGVNSVAFATDADIVIAKVDGVTRAHSVLVSQTVSKPTNSTTPESVVISIAPPISVLLSPTDQLVWSIRGRGASTAGAWVVLNDSQVRISLTRILDCTADFNRDGQVDFFDYLDFIQAFDDCTE